MTGIAVAIVNHNTRQDLQACLDSVDLEAPSEVVVVDNASSDGSAEMVHTRYPNVVLYTNKINVGYGAAANQAIASCTAGYVLLLNSDTRLQPGALSALSAYLNENPRAAIVGPRLVNPDGTLQASCYPFPTPLDTFLENSNYTVLLGRLVRQYLPIVRGLYLRTWAHDQPRLVPWLKGAALAIRREAFEAVGGFDKSFFMYFEDADLCYRFKAASWEIHFAPVTTVVHVGGASTSRYRVEMAVQLLASTVQFHKRHSSKIRIAETNLIIKILTLAKWIGGTLRFYISNEKKRQEIYEDIAANRRVFFGQWLE